MGHPLRSGILYGTSAFLLWGLSPVYWKLLDQVPAPEILAHRIVWSAVLMSGWVILARRWRDVRDVLRRRSTVLALAATTVLISVNWGFFIFAVNADRVVEASLGYYINPLVSVVFGLVFLGERLDRVQAVAVGLAAVGVAVMTARTGSLPWLSLVLAVSFALYGLLRKIVEADAEIGLTIETALLTVPASFFLMHLERSGAAALGHASIATDLLLIMAGPVTAIPLLLFTRGARRLPLSTIGLLQYISPTVNLLLAVVFYGEHFTGAHAVAFGCIWAALALYTLDLRRRLRPRREVAG